MKVILSRKGMDSEAGKMPSPILPDGTLLSLPIPDKNSDRKYSEIYYKGQSLEEIIGQLMPRFDFKSFPTCHVDPDIYDDILPKPPGWKAAFGQWGIPAAHLDKKAVALGDIFLFYGMFRQTEMFGNKLRFVRKAPVQHIIYGYMKVGEIEKNEANISRNYHWHPHSAASIYPNNRLYLPSEYGTFKYSDPLLLTKKGQECRSIWTLPGFFAEPGIEISWHTNNHAVRDGESALLKSSRRGQEFVIEAAGSQEQELISWVNGLVSIGKRG